VAPTDPTPPQIEPKFSAHLWHSRPAQVEQPAHVDIHHSSPVGVGRAQRVSPMYRSRRVHENVELAMPVDDRVDRSRAERRVADVADKRFARP